MHAVIRSYTGASELIAAMKQKQGDVKELLEGVAGFIAYFAVEAGDRLTTVTVCDGAAGTTESTQRASSWIRENLSCRTGGARSMGGLRRGHAGCGSCPP